MGCTAVRCNFVNGVVNTEEVVAEADVARTMTESAANNFMLTEVDDEDTPSVFDIYSTHWHFERT